MTQDFVLNYKNQAITCTSFSTKLKKWWYSTILKKWFWCGCSQEDHFEIYLGEIANCCKRWDLCLERKIVNTVLHESLHVDIDNVYSKWLVKGEEKVVTALSTQLIPFKVKEAGK